MKRALIIFEYDESVITDDSDYWKCFEKALCGDPSVWRSKLPELRVVMIESEMNQNDLILIKYFAGKD